ncbi:hypothetical protein [Thioclava sp. L04-15]|nr:hypothetical protein [Thioclava sp. L04-15]
MKKLKIKYGNLTIEAAEVSAITVGVVVIGVALFGATAAWLTGWV